MATRSVHARSSGAVKPAIKAAARRSHPKKKPRVIRSAARTTTGGSSAWSARDRKYGEIFGAIFPKGRVFSPEGVTVTTQAGARLELCLAQYAPTPERMSWVYVTHGLSQSDKRGKTGRIELLLHSRERDAAAARVLTQAARYLLESGNPFSPGDVLSSAQIADAGLPGMQHWIAAAPDKPVPEKIEQPGGALRLMLLLGVSDAEMQVALKVNAELADGRRVLLEALRVGGVFPVTDPKRTCLTRRRDFHRLWECAFRTVRENENKA